MEVTPIDTELKEMFERIAQLENIDLKNLDPNLPQLDSYLTLLFNS